MHDPCMQVQHGFRIGPCNPSVYPPRPAVPAYTKATVTNTHTTHTLLRDTHCRLLCSASHA